ncbi:MAG: hypothetical protein JSV60_10115 [Desulfobacterales bacterium]|nr:MAG: hypothetical protein JSV60_10115 [Desulfobacterales bacterium]
MTIGLSITYLNNMRKENTVKVGIVGGQNSHFYSNFLYNCVNQRGKKAVWRGRLLGQIAAIESTLWPKKVCDHPKTHQHFTYLRMRQGALSLQDLPNESVGSPVEITFDLSLQCIDKLIWRDAGRYDTAA